MADQRSGKAREYNYILEFNSVLGGLARILKL
jgi:hypothetical protein